MAQILVRGVDDAVIDRLRKRAEGHNRSLEAELRDILEQASRQVDVTSARRSAADLHRKLEGHPHFDSAELIREDRER